MENPQLLTLLAQDGDLNAENFPAKSKPCSKWEKSLNQEQFQAVAAKDQGIFSLYIVMPSFPLKIMLYKYLQGNDINEGRELFTVPKMAGYPAVS